MKKIVSALLMLLLPMVAMAEGEKTFSLSVQMTTDLQNGYLLGDQYELQNLPPDFDPVTLDNQYITPVGDGSQVIEGSWIRIFTHRAFGWRNVTVTVNGTEQVVNEWGSVAAFRVTKNTQIKIDFSGDSELKSTAIRVKFAVRGYEVAKGDTYECNTASQSIPSFETFYNNTLHAYGKIFRFGATVDTEKYPGRTASMFVNGKPYETRVKAEVGDETSYIVPFYENSTVVIYFGETPYYTVNHGARGNIASDTYKVQYLKDDVWTDVVSGTKFPINTQIKVITKVSAADRYFYETANTLDVADEIDENGEYFFYLTEDTDIDVYYTTKYTMSYTVTGKGNNDVATIKMWNEKEKQYQNFTSGQLYEKGSKILVTANSVYNESVVSLKEDGNDVSLSATNTYEITLDKNTQLDINFTPAAVVTYSAVGQESKDSYQVRILSEGENPQYESFKSGSVYVKGRKFRVDASTTDPMHRVVVKVNNEAVTLDSDNSYYFAANFNTKVVVEFVRYFTMSYQVDGKTKDDTFSITTSGESITMANGMKAYKEGSEYVISMSSAIANREMSVTINGEALAKGQDGRYRFNLSANSLVEVIFSGGLTTGIDDCQTSLKKDSYKTIENGRVVIYRNGVAYDLAGQRIK